MFEYIEAGFVILSVITTLGLLLIAILESGKSKVENKPTKVKYFLLILMSLSIVSPFYDSLDTTNAIKKNTKSFNDGTEMKCIAGFTPYLISKENGWKLHKDSFLKNDILIRADRCEEE